MSEQFPEQSSKYESRPSKYENGSSYPRTLEDFRLRAAEIEQERAMIQAALIDGGHTPKDVPEFTHLLGKLGAINEQIRAMETEQLNDQFKQ